MTNRVRYIGADDAQVNWGNNTDPRGLLTEGQIYEVSSTDIHSWHTKVRLVGIDGAFNSVCFEDVKE